jgi:hypothetical protein
MIKWYKRDGNGAISKRKQEQLDLYKMIVAKKIFRRHHCRIQMREWIFCHRNCQIQMRE